jgi:hypothetical protein
MCEIIFTVVPMLSPHKLGYFASGTYHCITLVAMCIVVKEASKHAQIVSM